VADGAARKTFKREAKRASRRTGKVKIGEYLAE
jgi:hypothetical protein